MISNKPILLIFIQLSIGLIPPVGVQFGNITGYFIKGINIYFTDIFDELIYLLNLRLIDYELITFLEKPINLHSEVRILQQQSIYLDETIIVIRVLFILF
jgi:hypothetical protein